MLNDVAKAWVEALRSGDYEQGKGKLRTLDSKFCCLGVLCDLAVEAGVIPAPTSVGHMGFLYGNRLAVLPEEVQQWAGLRSPSGDHSAGDEGLVEDNDGGLTFLQIAALIEAEPEGLFV